MPSFGETPQGPFNAFFPKGQNSAFGIHNLNVIGSGIFGSRSPANLGTLSGSSTGLVPATGVGSGGVQGVSATYVGTGIYSIRFPPTRSVNIQPFVSSSSGYNFQGVVNNMSGPSGSAQLEITRISAPGGATGYNPIQASGFTGYLPTGTVVQLSFFAAPQDGITY